MGRRGRAQIRRPERILNTANLQRLWDRAKATQNGWGTVGQSCGREDRIFEPDGLFERRIGPAICRSNEQKGGVRFCHRSDRLEPHDGPATLLARIIERCPFFWGWASKRAGLGWVSRCAFLTSSVCERSVGASQERRRTGPMLWELERVGRMLCWVVMKVF